ncbi:MAG: ABC1 kinase family protein [Leptolyngbyaceae cyanobacterium]
MSVLSSQDISNHHTSGSQAPSQDAASPVAGVFSIEHPVGSNRTRRSTIAQPAREYDWSHENYSAQKRFVQIWSFVLRLMLEQWLYKRSWSYAGGMTDATQARRRRRLAIWIRETFLNLGPTFIKLGQLFSTRADLFPTEYVEELTKLQDRVPAFNYGQVQTIVSQDFGRPLTELFSVFDPVPLAAASLGQVHHAQLYSGEEVVVKVQRPGLKRLFEIDLGILKGIAHYFQRHPKWGKGRDWLGIYDECRRILWEEIDYLNEGRNADTFRRNFRSVEWVNVPRVYWRYASPRVLTMEYMPGIKINHYEALEAAGLSRTSLAQMGAEAYLHQLLRDGFFHADPHPGNLAVSPEGALIFYDFGMMGRVQSGTREKLMGVFFGVAQKDAERVVSSLVELGALAPVEDMGPVRRSVQYMLDHFMDKPFENQSVNEISDDLYEIAYDQPFRFPATFTFVMRAFSTLEGVGKGLDPEFNFMEVAKPFAMQLMSNGNSPQSSITNDLLNELGRQAAQVSTSALGLPQRLEGTIEKLDRGDVRIRVRATETDRALRRLSSVNMGSNYAILVATFVISSTMLLTSGYAWLAAAIASLTLIPGVAFLRLLIRINRSDRMF